jgi:3-hydroxypropanoate dehydrogenase
MTQTQHAAAHSNEISNGALDQLFRQARTHSAWLPKRVPIEKMREAYELARLGPTSANSSPARFVFLESEAAKARLSPALAPLNVVTVIVAWDTEFYEKLPQLFPRADMRSYFAGNKALIDETASATVRCRELTSYSPLKSRDLIVGRCRALIRRK